MKITDSNQIATYYKALVNKDERFVGIFFVGVKTTSIFCIANCRARKPKLENVVFYSTFKEALNEGFRPCKICKPTQNANQAPKEIEKAIELVKVNPKEKISDYCLKENGISAKVVRQWFKKHYGMTFHAYQRLYRINTAFQELKQGKPTTQTAFEMGYESLSGFGYTFKKTMGKSPMSSKEKATILMSRLTTPLGAMFVCATEKGICLLEFSDRKMLETEFADLQKRQNAVILTGENRHITQAKKELEEYFEGKRTNFEVALDPVGTDFQKSVWEGLHQIEYGKTRSYQEQSEHLGNPKAIRAIASANGMNKISIIIPCHRVIGKDGKLTGYGGGLERKKWLLLHENKYNPNKENQKEPSLF
ncbi:bifunctional transcriptional activator/DNA repair enzyme AdaA [Bernardetia sp.]|uniref:bifunctional transcriptional activator/DNA repair enzyme AdaA n=1 Tax=Bernardetia sp. TaxID=1937974 RepID=UPI0025B8ABE1|nr:bifunctional transcriptional activator/DNA repair protein Ada [Bernardetia sp.]